MADVHVNALTPLTAEPSASDSLVAVNRGTNEGMIIDYNLLADVILSKIGSKQYSDLTTASKLLPGAINELDADAASLAADVADNATAISALNSRLDGKQSKVIIGSFTATPSAAGNASYNFGKNVWVLAAATNTSDVVVLPYPSAGGSVSGRATWWFHICRANTSFDPYTAESQTLYAAYIEM